MFHHSKISIQINQPYYLPGETVYGTVNLQVSQAMPGKQLLQIQWRGKEEVKARDTVLKFYPEEIVNWIFGGSGGMPIKKKKKDRDDDSTIFQTIHTICEFDDGIPVGNYSLPIQFRLPSVLPGVCQKKLITDDSKQKKKDLKKGDDVVSVSTIYDIMCWVDSVLMHREEFGVCEKFTKTPKPIHAEKSKDIFMSGLIRMTVDLDRDVFLIGESFPISIVVDNQSRRNVDTIKVKLVGVASVQIGQKSKTALYEEYQTPYEGVPHKSCCQRVLDFTIRANIWPSSQGKVSSYQYQIHVVCEIKQAFPIQVCFDVGLTIPKALQREIKK